MDQKRIGYKQEQLNSEPFNQILDCYNQQQQQVQANYEVSLNNLRQQLKIMRSENEVLRQIASEYFQNINKIGQIG